MVAGRCVIPKATIGEVHDDKQQKQYDDDDREHFHPAWCAAGVTIASVAMRVSFGRQVSHAVATSMTEHRGNSHHPLLLHFRVAQAQRVDPGQPVQCGPAGFHVRDSPLERGLARRIVGRAFVPTLDRIRPVPARPVQGEYGRRGEHPER